MKKGWTLGIITALALTVGVMSVATTPQLVNAARSPEIEEACAQNPDASFCSGEVESDDRLPTIGRNIINTALFIVGILAVAMIIFSGIRYVTSTGDKKRIEQSKSILIYSVTGLIVALLAYTVINFVLNLLQ